MVDLFIYHVSGASQDAWVIRKSSSLVWHVSSSVVRSMMPQNGNWQRLEKVSAELAYEYVKELMQMIASAWE